MLNSKIAESQSTNTQSIKFKKLTIAAAADVLLSSISLLFKSKIIKFEKMRTYKDQSENKHQRWFRDVKIKIMSVSEYFVIDKIKIL